MTLTDPREALAEQSNFIGYLVGVAGLAQLVHTLAADGDPTRGSAVDADDFVHLLLGVASLGEAIERLAESALAQRLRASQPPPARRPGRWLR